jgi:hypothetical protein
MSRFAQRQIAAEIDVTKGFTATRRAECSARSGYREGTQLDGDALAESKVCNLTQMNADERR